MNEQPKDKHGNVILVVYHDPLKPEKDQCILKETTGGEVPADEGWYYQTTKSDGSGYGQWQGPFKDREEAAFEGKYPVHAAFHRRKEEHRAVTNFLNWLEDEKEYNISYEEEVIDDEEEASLNARRRFTNQDEVDWESLPDDERLRTTIRQRVRLRTLIADYFEIDEDEFENEKRRMLEEIREHNRQQDEATKQQSNGN